MTLPYYQPLLVHKDGSVQSLRPVDLTNKGTSEYDEEWLQALLYRYPSALPVSEIDQSFADLVPLCMEMDTPAGPVDALYVTPTGRLALLETKLWRNHEARRKVIAQILDYATQLSLWDYSRLDSAVRQARRRLYPTEVFPGLGAWMVEQRPGISEPRFNDSVTKSLSRGDFLLLIAGDGIREGAGAIAQFLDRYGALHFSFGLIECAIYESPDGARFVQPRVHASTTKVERTFARLAGDQLVMQDASPSGEEFGTPEVSPELLENRARHEAYWSEFLSKLTLEDGQPISKPATSTNQYFKMPSGSHGWVSAYLAQSKGQAGVYLTFEKGDIGDQLFEGLRMAKQEIDAALGDGAEWTGASEPRHSVFVKKTFPGTLMGESRQATQDWLADATQRFVSVFRPRIDALLRESA